MNLELDSNNKLVAMYFKRGDRFDFWWNGLKTIYCRRELKFWQHREQIDSYCKLWFPGFSTGLLAFVPGGVINYQWQTQSRKVLGFGWATFGWANSLITLYSTGLLDPVQTITGHLCRTHAIYRVTPCPASGSFCPHFSELMTCIVRQGLTLGSCPSFPSHYPHDKPTSCHWSCIKFSLLGGCDKYRLVLREAKHTRYYNSPPK